MAGKTKSTGASSVKLIFDMGMLKVNLTNLPHDIDRTISGYMMSQAPRVQDYARANAPWTDQTGNARQGLFAKYSGKGDSFMKGVHQIDLYHTMPYGIWLEVRFAGRNAIIAPTVQAEGHRIMSGLHGLLGRLGAVA